MAEKDVEEMRVALPADFVDRPRLKRWWAHLLVIFRRRPIKAVCCESFRKGKVACKGCATLYDRNSEHWLYRMIARIGKRKSANEEDCVTR